MNTANTTATSRQQVLNIRASDPANRYQYMYFTMLLYCIVYCLVLSRARVNLSTLLYYILIKRRARARECHVGMNNDRYWCITIKYRDVVDNNRSLERNQNQNGKWEDVHTGADDHVSITEKRWDMCMLDIEPWVRNDNGDKEIEGEVYTRVHECDNVSIKATIHLCYRGCVGY